jgi:hypothetical protein
MKTIFLNYHLCLLLISTFLFNVSLSEAQSDYREGYIINDNFDTIYGFIIIMTFFIPVGLKIN